jgi:hypothetical protein
VPAVPAHAGRALDTDGYVVVPTGLPSSILEAVVDDIWRHANARPGDPATWYQPRRIEEQRDELATLGPLGRRLLGLDEWAHAPGTP